MNKSMFHYPGPQVTKIEHGREPTLREIIEQYYTLNGIERKKALQLTEDYINGWLKENK